MFTFMKAIWPVEDPITKAMLRTDTAAAQPAPLPLNTTSSVDTMRIASGKGRTAVIAKLIEERNIYQALLRRGKGTWNTPDYVSDETWACWLHTLAALERILDAK